MAMAITMRDYLRAVDVHYDEVPHPREVSATHIAQGAHIPGKQMAKAVLIKGDSGYRLVLVPSTVRVDLGGISHQFRERLGLATEDEIQAVFPDCDPGAVPALGQPYGVRVCYDAALAGNTDIYMEAGDHETLVHMDNNEFQRLMSGADRGSYSC